MFKSTKNTVARILKIYALINAFSSIVLALIANENTPISIAGTLAWTLFFSGVVISFGIFTLGEIVELLEKIKCNTEKKEDEEDDEPLPEL